MMQEAKGVNSQEQNCSAIFFTRAQLDTRRYIKSTVTGMTDAPKVLLTLAALQAQSVYKDNMFLSNSS